MSRTLVGLQRDEGAVVIAGFVARGPLAGMARSDTPERVAQMTVKARDRLGTDAYDSALARGTAMTIDEAILYARTELDATTNELNQIEPLSPDGLET